MGCAKALLPLNGGNLLEHVASVVRGVVRDVALIGRRPSAGDPSGTPVENAARPPSAVHDLRESCGSRSQRRSLTTDSLPVIDDVPDIGGPLAGILAALRSDAAADWLIVATDMPLISPAAIAWLLSQQTPAARAVLPRRATGIVEPLFAIYMSSVLPEVERLVRAGLRSARAIAKEPGVESPTIPPDLESAWTSVNTPAEWCAVQSQL